MRVHLWVPDCHGDKDTIGMIFLKSKLVMVNLCNIIIFVMTVQAYIKV